MEKFSHAGERLLGKYEIDGDGYVRFGDIARGELNMQSQYASHYISGLDAPRIADDLRIKGDPDKYHEMKIHKDDVATFVERVREARATRGSL